MLKNRHDFRTILFVMGLLAVRVSFQVYEYFQFYWIVVFSLWNYIILVATHNHVHNHLFKRQKLNRALDYLLTVLTMGSVTNLYGVHALNHHVHNDSEGDWFTSKQVNYKWRFLNIIIYPIKAFAAAVKNRESLFLQKKYQHLMIRKRNEGIVLFLFVVVLLFQNWSAALLFWILPGFLGKYLLAITNLLQHVGCDENSEYNHSRNFKGAVINWVMFNNGYHTIHHMKPSLHWSELPQFHEKLIAHKIHKNLECRSQLLFLIQHYILPLKKDNTIHSESKNVSDD